MTRRSAAATGAVALLGLLLGGCGDPGLPTPGIALATDAGGTTTVVGLTCEASGTFELSSGTDLWSAPDVRVELDEPGVAHEIDLSAVADSGTFVVGDQQVLDDLSGAFAVRFYGDGAPVGAVVFDGVPEAGRGLVVLENGDSEATDVDDVADVARLNHAVC